MLIAIKLSEENKVPRRVQLLRVGEFLSDDQGDFKITKDMLKSFKRNFDEKVRGYEDGKLPIDYFHDNEKIAAGWMSGVELNDEQTELWVEVEWTKSAESKLADRELRYISAEFHLNYQHNEGGKKFGPTLFGAGLTNRPFIKGMKAVAASEGANEMTLEQALAKIKELEAMVAEMKQAAEPPKPEGEQSEELSAAKKELSELKAKHAAEAKLNVKKDAFSKMLSEGKVVEAQREAFLSDDMTKFAELAMKTNTEAKGHSGTEGKETSEEKSSQDQVIELAEKMVKEKGITLSQAIAQVLKDNKKLSEGYDKEVVVA